MREELAEDELYIKRFIKMPGFNLDSFFDIGFESVIIAFLTGLLFGVLVGVYPLIISYLSFLPEVNILLFIAFGIPLTGSSHFAPKLGLISSTTILVTARVAQFGFGLAPLTESFLLIGGLWTLAQIILIGYLPGVFIPTSENLSFLFKGLFKVTIIYGALEVFISNIAIDAQLSTDILLAYPLMSIPLIMGVSTLTTFIFTNTFCPYMMMPLISRAIKGQRHCGAGNFIFKINKPVSFNDNKIKKAQKKGFRVVSKLPSVTVFSCPRGGIISVYNSGEILMRKVNKGTAERINKYLTPIILGDN